MFVYHHSKKSDSAWCLFYTYAGDRPPAFCVFYLLLLLLKNLKYAFGETKEFPLTKHCI